MSTDNSSIAQGGGLLRTEMFVVAATQNDDRLEEPTNKVACPFPGMDRELTDEESHELATRVRSYFLDKGLIDDA
jgi:hypothetical protein